MKVQLLPILLVVAVLGSCVEGYAYYSSAGRDMYEKTEATSNMDAIIALETKQAELYKRVLDNTAKIAYLEKVVRGY